MLDGAELRAFSVWCAEHALRWLPATAECGIGAMVLEPAQRRRAWERMLLLLREDGFHLVTEDGEALAKASDLLALLDALDSGVAEPEWRPPQQRGSRRNAEAALSPGYVV